MRVVIAEDQILLREGLSRLFVDAGHEVVGAFGDAEGVPAALQSLRPDLLVADVRMPPSFTDEGLRLARWAKAELPGLGVLVLSQHVETSSSLDLVGLGGFGYLLKDRVLAIDEFLTAAQRVADGGSALDPQVVGRLVAASRDEDPVATLSVREREVLNLMAQGLTNAGIARRLVLSERTVEAHVRHVLLKLDVPEDVEGNRRVLAVLAYLRSLPDTR
ncbi:response regulator transcription factor [soil metagenome]